jgi:hypothetical protein
MYISLSIRYNSFFYYAFYRMLFLALCDNSYLAPLFSNLIVEYVKLV